MPCPGSAGLVLPPINSFIINTEPLPYHDFSDSIAYRNPLLNNPVILHLHSDIFSHIIHPYDTAAFERLLTKHNLFSFYPLLVTNLRNGFPLGDMPALTKTVILKNHPSCTQYADTVHQYLIDEVKAGRMSGPFSRQHVEFLLRGAFFLSPLLVSVQTQQPGVPDKLRVCRHLSKGDRANTSVNSYIHKEQFPTRFDTASRVADVVSLHLHSILSVYSAILLSCVSRPGPIHISGVSTPCFTSGDSTSMLHLW